MNSPWRKVVGLASLVALALLVSLPKVHAFSAANGKFQLPFDAKMGNMTLPAGEYEYSVQDMSRTGKIVIYQGTKYATVLHAQSFDDREKQSEKPVLIFVRHDGSASLRAFKFPGAGTFYFPLSKEMSNLVAQQPQLIETVQVQAFGD